MINIICGENNCGKTAKIKSIYESAGKGDGFVTRKIFSGPIFLGYEITRLSTGESVTQSLKTEYFPLNDTPVYIKGPFSFYPEGFSFADSVIDDIISKGINPVFIDEIGLLELKGQGHHDSFNKILKTGRTVYFTVRRYCLEKALSVFSIENYNLIDLNNISTSHIPRQHSLGDLQASDFFTDTDNFYHDTKQFEAPHMKIEFTPIGIIHTPFKTIENIPIQSAADNDSEGFIEIFDKYSAGLADLDGFSHLYLIFHLHKCTGYKLKVIPFLDTVERGIFATRSPARPNPIGLSVVKVISVSGNIIKVQGLDILDGTPIIDIKPYVPQFEDTKDVKTGWFTGKMNSLKGRVSDGRFK